MTIGTRVSRCAAFGGALLLTFLAQTSLSSQSAGSYALERDDLLASCSAEFNGTVAVLSNVRNLAGRQEALVNWDKLHGVDKAFWRVRRDSLVKLLAGMKATSAEQNPDLTAWSRADQALDICTMTRRIAQLDGATLVSGWSVATVPADDPSTAVPLKADSKAPGANDLLWSCSAQFEAVARTTPVSRQSAMTIYTRFQDLFVPNGTTPEQEFIRNTKIPSETKRSQAPGITAADAAVSAFKLCTLHRRLEQLAGAELAAPPAMRAAAAPTPATRRTAPATSTADPTAQAVVDGLNTVVDAINKGRSSPSPSAAQRAAAPAPARSPRTAPERPTQLALASADTCTVYQGLEHRAGRQYHQLTNTCGFGINVWFDVRIDGELREYDAIDGHILAGQTSRTSFAVLQSSRWTVTRKYTCPDKEEVARRTGRRVAGSYWQAGRGCYANFESDPVGVVR
jgi:hypothetical protein